MEKIHPIFRIICDCFNTCFRELFDGGVFGDENLPRTGPYLLACNHLSFWDPPFIGASVFNREIFPFARKTLFRTPFRNWLFSRLNCIPVDRDGSDIAAIKTVFKLLKSGKPVMIFPEGTRSYDGNLLPAQPGVGMLALKTNVPVIPCRIFGAYEIMNRLSSWPDWNVTADIVFGKPILPEEFMKFSTSENKHQQVADYIMEKITELKLPNKNIL